MTTDTSEFRKGYLAGLRAAQKVAAEIAGAYAIGVDRPKVNHWRFEAADLCRLSIMDDADIYEAEFDLMPY